LNEGEKLMGILYLAGDGQLVGNLDRKLTFPDIVPMNKTRFHAWSTTTGRLVIIKLTVSWGGGR
jgi:hypothetical protein